MTNQSFHAAKMMYRNRTSVVGVVLCVTVQVLVIFLRSEELFPRDADFDTVPPVIIGGDSLPLARTILDERIHTSNSSGLSGNSSMTLRRTAIVLTTKGISNECDAFALFNLVKSSPGMDVWALINPPESLSEMERNISAAYLRDIPGLHIGYQGNASAAEVASRFVGHSGNSKVAFLKFLDENKDKYDFAWHIENDVFYSGPWIEFFEDEARDSHSDFVSGSVRVPVKQVWKTGRPCKTYGRLCRLQKMYQAGWQIARVSSSLASTLLRGIRESQVLGHHEAVVYPVAVANNFTVRQIDTSKILLMAYAAKTERSLNRDHIRSLVKLNPPPGRLIHAVKCEHYGNISQAPSDFAKFTDRPALSREDLWELQTANVPVMPIRILEANKEDKHCTSGFQNALQRLGPNWANALVKGENSTTTVPPLLTERKLVQKGNGSTFGDEALDASPIETDPYPHRAGASPVDLNLIQAITEAYQSGSETFLMVLDSCSFLPRIAAAKLQSEISLVSKRHRQWEMLVLRATDKVYVHPVYERGGWELWEPSVNSKLLALVLHRRGMISILSKSFNKTTGTLNPLPKDFASLFALTAPEAYISTGRMIVDQDVLEGDRRFLVSPEYL